MVVLAAAQAATAGDDDLGSAQFGTLGLGQFAAEQLALCGVGGGAQGFNGGRATGGDGVEGGGTDGDHLDRVGALDRRQRVAGVDRADEGIGGFDTDDFGDLGDVEQRGDARRDVFTEGGGRGQDVAVAGGVGDDQGGSGFPRSGRRTGRHRRP